MHGKIIQYNTNEGKGFIILEDKTKVEFLVANWEDYEHAPEVGQTVEYSENSIHVLKTVDRKNNIQTHVLTSFFSIKGCATRQQWWTINLLDALFIFIISFTSTVNPIISLVLFLLFFIPASWALVAVTAKRMHAVNRSAWWMFVPIFSFYWAGFQNSITDNNPYCQETELGHTNIKVLSKEEKTVLKYKLLFIISLIIMIVSNIFSYSFSPLLHLIDSMLLLFSEDIFHVSIGYFIHSIILFISPILTIYYGSRLTFKIKENNKKAFPLYLSSLFLFILVSVLPLVNF